MLEGVVSCKKIYSILFQTKDHGIRRQKLLLNPSLVLYFGNYGSSNLRTKSVRNFQLVLSCLYTERRPVEKYHRLWGQLSVLPPPPSTQVFLKGLDSPFRYVYISSNCLFLFLNQ